MPALLIYLIKVNIALIIFCLGYYAVLRHLTFYTLNRAYLVTAILFSTLYPFIDLSAFISRHQEIARPVQVVVINWQQPAQTLVQNVAAHSQWYWLLIAFWMGVLVLTVRFITQLFSLYRLHQQSVPVQVRQYMIRVINGDINPFSFWKSIYINPANHPPHELDAILEHEQIHVNDWHTLDILLGEVSTIFYWFNPGIWLMKRAIRENIEFITDRKILQKGIDCKVYQYSLINVNFGARSNAIVNHFNTSTIKKRIMMMNTKKSSSLNLTRYMFLVPAVIILLLVFSVSKAELNKAAKNSTHMFNKALTTVADKLDINIKGNEHKNKDLLKAVSVMDIPADSLNIQPKLSGFTFAAADTNKLNIGGGFTDAIIYIDGEKSTRDDLLHLDAGQIAKMMLYTDMPKNDHDDDIKHYLFVITKKNVDSERVNVFLNEFRKNDSTAIAHNYAITPVSKTSSRLNISSAVYPASVINSFNSKMGVSKKTSQPLVVKMYDSVYAFNAGHMQKISAREASEFSTASPVKSTLNLITKPNSFIYIDKNGVTNRVITVPIPASKIEKVAVMDNYSTTGKKDTTTDAQKDKTLKQLIERMDPNSLNKVTKMRVNGTTFSKAQIDSGLKTLQGGKVDKNAAIIKYGKPLPGFFFAQMFSGSIDFKDKLIIIDGKEATQKQLKKLSADKIETINTMARDTAFSKYGDKAKNGVITISTKKQN